MQYKHDHGGAGPTNHLTTVKTMDQIASLTRGIDKNSVNYFSKLEKELNTRQEKAMSIA